MPAVAATVGFIRLRRLAALVSCCDFAVSAAGPNKAAGLAHVDVQATWPAVAWSKYFLCIHVSVWSSTPVHSAAILPHAPCHRARIAAWTRLENLDMSYPCPTSAAGSVRMSRSALEALQSPYTFQHSSVRRRCDPVLSEARHATLTKFAKHFNL